MEILRRKTDEVSYPLGETDQHEDQSWKTFCTQCILKEELSDTDSEQEPMLWGVDRGTKLTQF